MVCLYIFISFYPKVVGIVGDGASSNRRFFKLQDIINEGGGTNRWCQLQGQEPFCT